MSNGTKEIEQSLGQISEAVFKNFHKLCKFRHFDILAQDDRNLHVYSIFKKEKDRQKYERNAGGMQKRLVEFVNTQLEQHGLGKKEEYILNYESDSDEAMKDNMRRAQNIPTDEDFARADRLDKERYRNIDKVGENVLKFFKKICPQSYSLNSYGVFTFVEEPMEFRVYIFYRLDSDIKESERNGTQQELIDFVYAELERNDRGRREEIKVEFEFDSDENVEANYEGDYYLRLR